MRNRSGFNMIVKAAVAAAVAVMLLFVNAAPAFAQETQDTTQTQDAQARQGEAEQAAAATQTNPADLPPPKKDDAAPQKDSAEAVMDNLMEQMKKNPMIEPTPAGKPGEAAQGSTPGAGSAAVPGQAVGVRVDPNIVGTAPGAKAPTLRREGEFVISRKGRLVRSGDGMHTLFVFDADSKDSPEAPMAVVPCQMLQSMEDLMGQRGDQIKFILSGQILVYRGVNYVLPTMMTLAEDRGNLQ